MPADPCADPGIFARVVQKTALTTVFVFLSSTFTVLHLNKVWGSNLFQGVKLFPGGGGWAGVGDGVQILILETHRTCDFPGGDADPLSPLWIRACDHLTTRK